MDMDLGLSNLSIAVASIFGASWLLNKGYIWSGIAIFGCGFSWWGIDQIVRWSRMKYHYIHET